MNRIIIIASFISIFSLSSCFEYEDVKFNGVKDFKLTNNKEENLLIKLDLEVYNPNKYKITIKPAILDVYVNGKYAGKTKMKDKIVLEKQKKGIYPLYLKAKTKDILGALTGSLGSFLSGKINIGIKGKVKAKVYGIGKKFDLDEEQRVSLKGIM